jgi:hypothetical protein
VKSWQNTGRPTVSLIWLPWAWHFFFVALPYSPQPVPCPFLSSIGLVVVPLLPPVPVTLHSVLPSDALLPTSLCSSLCTARSPPSRTSARRRSAAAWAPAAPAFHAACRPAPTRPARWTWRSRTKVSAHQWHLSYTQAAPRRQLDRRNVKGWRILGTQLKESGCEGLIRVPSEHLVTRRAVATQQNECHNLP